MFVELSGNLVFSKNRDVTGRRSEPLRIIKSILLYALLAGQLASRQSAFFVESCRNARQPLNLVDAVAFPLRGWNALLHEASESPPPRERSVHLAARVDDDLTDARERSRSAGRPMVIGEAKRRRRRDARSSSSSSLGQPGPSLAVVAKTFPLALLFGR